MVGVLIHSATSLNLIVSLLRASHTGQDCFFDSLYQRDNQVVHECGNQTVLCVMTSSFLSGIE